MGIVIEYLSKTIGLIMMGNSASAEREFHLAVPENIGVVTTRVPFYSISKTGLFEMIDCLTDAVKLLKQARSNVVVLPSAIGSYLRGSEIVNTIQQVAGLPTIIPSLQYKELLQRINAKNIMLVSSFSMELSLLATIYFDSCGVSVSDTIHIQNLIDTDPFNIEAMDYQQVFDKIRTYDFRGIDAVIFDNPAFRFSSDTICELEKHIQVPMFNLVQVLIFGALEHIGESTDNLYISKFLR